MQTQTGLLLRAVFIASAALTAVVGFAFWASYPGPLQALGIPLPQRYDELGPWRGIGMAGMFGGALLALATTLLALGLSRDRPRLLAASPIVLLGFCLLGFVAFAKVQAFEYAPPGRWLVLLVMAPVGLLIVGFALEIGRSMLSPATLRATDEAGLAERRRLARDLHDSVKQQIYAVHAHLAAAEARWETDLPTARAALAHARTGTRDALREMTALLDRLIVDPVEAVGFADALRRQCDALAFQTGAEVTAEFGVLPEGDRLDPIVTKAVFRIAQEALANVARHARPAHVFVFAGLTQRANDNTPFAVTVRDDGAGFDADMYSSAWTTGLGLRGMRSRATELGAILTVTSAIGQGTSVEVTLPLPARHEAVMNSTRRLLVGVGVPVLALSGWSASWPEWSPYLKPFIVTGIAAMLLVSARAAAVRWARA